MCARWEPGSEAEAERSVVVPGLRSRQEGPLAGTRFRFGNLRRFWRRRTVARRDAYVPMPPDATLDTGYGGRLYVHFTTMKLVLKPKL